MSNTSTVTPYAESGSGNSTGALGSAVGTTMAICAGAVGGAAGAAVVGTAAAAVGIFKMARWLARRAQADRDAITELEEGMDLPDITTLQLHLQGPDSLVSAAAKLGYQEIVGAEPQAQVGSPMILLQNSCGERLAITQNTHYRLAVHTAGDQMRIHALIRQHTEERALAHLRSKGMDVKNVRLANGELQILARESNAAQSRGATEVKAQVRADGTAYVDIDKCRGNRCEALVSDLARAVGGRVSGSNKKDAYFQLPGEPTKTQVKV